MCLMIEQRGLTEYVVGERFVTERRTVTEADVEAFAELTGDHHPQHLDPEWAASSMFGARVAHGMLVLSCAVGQLPLNSQRVLAMRGLRRVSFKRPVLLDSSVLVVGEIEAVKEIDGKVGVLTLAFDVLLDDDKVAIRGAIDALVRV